MKKIFLITSILLFAISIFAQGEVDWERRVVRAVGIGAPNPKAPNMAVKRAGAINAAKMVALKELVGTIKGMYISGKSTVENYMTTSDVISSQVEGIARAYRMVGRPTYLEDGSVEVTIEMSIDGELSGLALKGESFSEEATESGSSYTSSSTDTQTSQGAYSGLIIDCSEIGLRPALAPKVLDQTGKEIYGSAKVSKDFAVQQGMMGYLKNIDSAKGNSRVGENPFVIKAVATSGANSVDIVISNDDANKLNEMSSKLNFLRECRVIAVIK